ncbi:MAG: hypothetical protein NT070_01210 [Cyanobacteria bacterium]|nr:hypothetical protein [Cyanobacteriota bacterium]
MQEFPLYRSIQQEAQKSRSGALNLLRGGTYAISPRSIDRPLHRLVSWLASDIISISKIRLPIHSLIAGTTALPMSLPRRPSIREETP